MPGHNPYRSTRSVVAKPTPPPPYPPNARLRRLGATDEQLAEALRAWAELAPEDRQPAWDALEALTDEELRERLAEEPTGPPEPVMTTPKGQRRRRKAQSTRG